MGFVMKFRVISLLALASGLAFIHSPALGMRDPDESSSSRHLTPKSSRDLYTEIKFPLDELVTHYRSHRALGNGASAGDLIKFLVGIKDDKSWRKFSTAEQETIVAGVTSRAERLDLEDLVSKLNVVNRYRLVRSTNSASDAELVSFLLEIPKEKWEDIIPENRT